ATSAWPSARLGRDARRLGGVADGSADRHSGDQRSLRRLHAGGSRTRARRDLRSARRAQYRAWRIRYDRRLLRLRGAIRRLALSRRAALDAGGVRILGLAVEWIMIRPLYRRPFDTLV